jgi:hypothetical protein
LVALTPSDEETPRPKKDPADRPGDRDRDDSKDEPVEQPTTAEDRDRKPRKDRERGEDGSRKEERPEQPPTFRSLVSKADARNDHGSGPRYADLSAFALQGSTRRLRIFVGFEGTVPDRLAEREVMGIGVDLFLQDTAESDYQVFLDGGSDGWVAYLQTPDGFIDFPGTFYKAEDGFVVTLPWSSLGDMRRGFVSGFADHSSASSTPAGSSEDFVPESDRLRFERSR